MNKKKIFNFIAFFSFIPITSVIIFSCVNNDKKNIQLNNNIEEFSKTENEIKNESIRESNSDSSSSSSSGSTGGSSSGSTGGSSSGSTGDTPTDTPSETVKKTYITNAIISKGSDTDSTTLDKQIASDIYLAREKYPYDESKFFYSTVWKNFVFNSVLQNKPAGLTVNGVLDIQYSSYNNLTGELFISKVKVENWLNDSGTLEQSWKWIEADQPISVKGFKKINPTTIVSEFHVDDSNLTSKSPSSVSLNEIKNYIYSKKDQIVLNYPGTLTDSDINVLNIYPFNTDGTIICNIGINKCYDNRKGELKNCDINNVFARVRLTGFKINNLGTSIKNPSTSIEGFSDVLAQEFCKDGNTPSLEYQNRIKNFIKDNALANLPDNFGINNIVEIKYDSYNNLTGQLKINQIVLNYYKDQDGVVKSERNVFNTLITISGFKRVSASVFNSSVQITAPYLDTNVDSITYDQLRQWVNDNKNKIVLNAPENMQLSFSQADVKKDSKTGIIKIDKILAQRWYKEEKGEYVYNSPKIWVLEIKGFKQENFATSIKLTDTSVSSDPHLSILSSSEITYDNVYLKQFVLNNLVINPKNIQYSLNDIELTLGLSQPLRGILQITNIRLQKYSDENGEIKYGPKDFPGSFNLINFKISSQTIIKTNVNISNTNLGQKNIYKISDSEIESFVRDNSTLFISNLPILNIDDILVSDIIKNENSNTISLRISLNRYYNEKGQIIVVNSQNGNIPLSQNVTLVGFKPITYETIVKENTSISINEKKIPSIFFSRSASNTNPIRITKNDAISSLLFNFIKNNCLINLPDGFNPINDISSVSVSNISNRDGSITINEISLKKYKNEEGQVITNNQGFPFSCNLNIYGFGRVSNWTRFQERIPISNFNQYIPNIKNSSDSQIRTALYQYIKDHTLLSGQAPDSQKDYIILYLPSQEETGIDYLDTLENYLNISDIKLKTNGVDSYLEFKLILGVYFDRDYNLHVSSNPTIGDNNIIVSELVSVGNPNFDNNIRNDSVKDFFTRDNWRNTIIISCVGVGVIILIIILIVVAILQSNKKKENNIKELTVSNKYNMIENNNIIYDSNRSNEMIKRNNNINARPYNNDNKNNMSRNPNQRNINNYRTNSSQQNSSNKNK